MNEKRPSFQWYPMDYLSDLNVARMTWAQRGVYIHLLNYCWIEGSIPSDQGELDLIVSDPTIPLEPVLKCFVSDPSKPGQMIHKRLSLERSKQDNYRKKAVESGKKGGLKRAANKRLSKPPLENPIRVGQANPSSSSSTSSSVKESKQKKKSPPSKKLEIKILDYLNRQAAKSFKPTEANLKFITGRLGDGFTYEQFVKVINGRVKEWKFHGKMNEYLRPKTLFCPSNFDGYLNANGAEAQSGPTRNELEI